MKKSQFHTGEPELCGTVTVGERGQVVIPIEVRKELGVEPGDSMVAMVHNHALVLLPKKQMKAFITALAKKLNI